MPGPLFWLAGAGVAWLLTDSVENAANAADTATNSALKILVIGGVSYAVIKTMRR